MTHVKAVVCTRYGPPEVLQLRDVPKPVPRGDEILVRIHAATVTAADVIDRSSSFPAWLWPFARLSLGVMRPREPILGFELAGDVEAVGRAAKRFKVGDRVFASTFEFGFGCYAEYTCLPENGAVEKKPANTTYEEAAAIPLGGLTALTFLRDRARIRSGQNVLVYGSSGSVGSFAVQLAKYYGADVTGVCSTTNLELVTALGADTVIDYTQEDFSRCGPTYDIIFDAVNKTCFSRCKASLRHGGMYLTTFPTLASILKMVWTSMFGSKKVVGGEASEKAEDLRFLRELVEAGKIRPVIDRCFSLEQIAEAHRYVETGHKKGNVVITVGLNSP